MPPSCATSGIDGMARSIRRLSASISPWIPPPRDIDHGEPGGVEDVTSRHHPIGGRRRHCRRRCAGRRLMQHLNPSPLRYVICASGCTFRSATRPVRNDDGFPVGALILDSTLSAERIDASATVRHALAQQVVRLNNVRPAFDTCSLPPT